MKLSMLPILAGLSLMWLTSAVASDSARPVPLEGLKKVGEARLQVLFWDIYDSVLYSADGHYQPGRYPLALQINYLRDIDAQDLIETTIEEWDKLGYAREVYQPWIESLSQMWPDLREGDELVVLVDKQMDSQFYYNGAALGKVDDPRFGAHFLAIWLDEQASFQKVRQKLTGAKP